MAGHTYLIKDVGRLSGLSIYTIKYYIKLGLINEVGRSPETNFRYFDDSTIADLETIKKLRNQKLSLKKIKEILTSKDQ